MKIHVDNEFSLRTAIFPSSLYYFSIHAAIRRVYCCMLIMLRMCARMKGKFYRYILLLSIGYMKALLYAQRVIIYARYVYKFHLAKLDMGLINYAPHKEIIVSCFRLSIIHSGPTTNPLYPLYFI